MGSPCANVCVPCVCVFSRWLAPFLSKRLWLLQYSVMGFCLSGLYALENPWAGRPRKRKTEKKEKRQPGGFLCTEIYSCRDVLLATKLGTTYTKEPYSWPLWGGPKWFVNERLIYQLLEKFCNFIKGLSIGFSVPFTLSVETSVYDFDRQWEQRFVC